MRRLLARLLRRRRRPARPTASRPILIVRDPAPRTRFPRPDDET